MGNPFYQPLDPAGAPDPVTPQVPSADPAGFGMVTPHGQGPAPYDIQAPTVEAELQSAYDMAGAQEGAGIVYAQSPRQAAAERVIASAAGYGDFDVLQGFSGQDNTTHGWPNDVRPAAEPDNGGYGGA